MRPVAACGSASAAAAWSGGYCWLSWRRCSISSPSSTSSATTFPSPSASPPPWRPSTWAPGRWRAGEPTPPGAARRRSLVRCCGWSATPSSARWRCSSCRCCSRWPMRCGSETAASRRAWASSGCLPVATVLYAAPTGVLAALVAPRRGRLLAFALPVLSILWTGLRLYRDPPVFAFDPFGGYFPGPIYDEALRPPTALMWFRLANLVWIAAAIAVAVAATGRGLDLRRWRRRALAAATPLLAIGAAAVRRRWEARLSRHARGPRTRARRRARHRSLRAPLRERRRKVPGRGGAGR